MASGPELVGRLGLDKSNYTRGLNEAERDFSRFTSNQMRETKRFGGAFGQTFHEAERVLKAFGAITIFSKFIDEFKSLSEWATKFGDKTDDSIRAASRWGSAWSSVLDVVKSKAAQQLGFFTKIGEYIGGLAKGESLGQTDALAASDDAAAAAEAQRDKYLKENNPERVKALREEIAKKEQALADKKLTTAQKVEEIDRKISELNDQAQQGDQTAVLHQLDLKNKIMDLEERRAALVEESDKKHAEAKKAEMDASIEQLDAEVTETIRLYDEEKKLAADKKKAAQEVADIEARAQAAKDKKKAEESGLTLGELANLDVFGAGVSMEAGAQGQKARDILALRNQAEAARKQGDVASYRDLIGQAQAEADQLHAPGGLLKPSEMPGDAAGQTNEELQKANQHLVEITAALKGKFVSQ